MGNIINPVLYFDDSDDDDDDEQINLRVHRRQLRDTLDPFHIPQKEFIRIYRLDKRSAMDLINELQPFMPPANGRRAIPNFLRVLVALNFMGSGSYQRRSGNDFSHTMSQTMVSRCLEYVTTALNDHLLNIYVQFPAEQDFRHIKQRFIENFNFNGIIGAVDGTQIAIVKPIEEEHAFINRHSYHSINAMITCTYDLLIVDINARYPGSSHDSFVYRSSSLRRKLKTMYQRGSRNFWLLGDSGYPLEPWLLTPVLNAPVNTPEYFYTQAHVAARNCVERCIGVLKKRFRCLLKDRVLHYAPLKAVKIINSCTILHNICINRNIPIIDHRRVNPNLIFNNANNNVFVNVNNNRYYNLGVQTRNMVINTQFT